MSQLTVSRASFWRMPPAALFVISAVLVLTVLGLLVLYSAGQSFDETTYFLKKQLVWIGLASVAGGFAFLVDLESTRKWVWLLGAVAVVLLVAVLIVGPPINGARRWIPLGGMSLQISEIGKLALVFCLAHYLAAHRRDLGHFVRGFLFPAMIAGVFCGLILVEPDFGTAFLCGAVGGGMMFLAGVRLRYLIPAAVLAVSGFAAMVYNDPLRMERITSFLNVEANKADSAYQLWQSILAFAAGGIRGVGLGEGRQQLDFLPEAHTDFIFAIVGEELGLLFTGGVVVLFMAVFLVVILQLRRAPNLYQYLLVLGALLFITFQAVINIGVVTGCLPTKGMSLPFISYGGSNLMFMFVAVGLILNGMRSWQHTALPKARNL